MLKVKTVNTVNGTANINVGSSDTRATNHDCNKNSRHANGLRGISTKVSNAMAKNPPTARTGSTTAPPGRNPLSPRVQSVSPGARFGTVVVWSPAAVISSPGGVPRPSTTVTA